MARTVEETRGHRALTKLARAAGEATLARELGVTRAAVSRWVRLRGRPGDDMRQKLVARGIPLPWWTTASERREMKAALGARY